MIVGDYILREKISENPLSTIWRANHRKDPDFKDVALQKIFLSMLTPKLKTCLDCELNFLSSVNHPSIIRLVKFFQVFIFLFLHFSLFFFGLPICLCSYYVFGFWLIILFTIFTGGFNRLSSDLGIWVF